MIDVLLPIFNGAQTLEQSIDSLFSQTYRDFRILAIDDGSTDETPQILERLARADTRLHVVRIPNGGLVHALNHGIRLCQAPFIARQDADDVSEPDRFARQISVFQRFPDVVAISGGHVHIDEGGREIGTGFAYDDPNDADFGIAPHREPYLPHPFLMMRRSALLGVGGTYRYVIHSEDTDLYWRLLEVGRLVNIKSVLGKYRMHAGSISSRSAAAGRIQATYSQAAGLSAMRRAEAQEDLHFPAAALERLKTQTELEEMIGGVDTQLDAAESRYFRACVSAKFLELLTYRPYQPSPADVAFICRHLRRPAFSRDAWRKSRRRLDELTLFLFRRLFSNKQFREAAAVARAFPSAIARRSWRVHIRGKS